MKKIIFTTIVLLTSIGFTNVSNLYAHCEIPCGIYGDETRITLLNEHIATVEKSMNQIIELSKKEEINYNQMVRWVNNKEEHATKIQEMVSQYFLHQRVKMADPSDEDAYKKYITQLTALHALQVYAMKAKQTTNIEFIQKMQEALKTFEASYFEGKHTHK